MRNQLGYLMIVQPGGIPLYSHSMNFISDIECQTFNNRLSDLDINPILLGGLFEAIKALFNELINDYLHLIDIGFSSYRVSGLVYKKLLFLGIFGIIRGENPEPQGEFFPYLGEIAEVFTRRFPKALDHMNNFDISTYEKFTGDLVNMGYALSLQDCRNCLTKCVDENKDCLPHLYYYKERAQSSKPTIEV